MRIAIRTVAAPGISLIIFLAAACSRKPADSELAAVSRQVVDGFQRELKTQLYAALEDSGTVGAVRICSQVAPAISARLSNMPGWSVKRVSSRNRNPNNVPDEFERAALEILENRPATAGDEYFSWVKDDHGDVFRFMKVIKVAAPCLDCHGDPGTLSEELKSLLAEIYPDDKATGFKLGDQRGAFSATVRWPEGEAVFDSLMTVASGGL